MADAASHRRSRKRARTLESVASLQVLARRALPALAEVPEVMTWSVDRAFPGRPYDVTVREDPNPYPGMVEYVGVNGQGVTSYGPTATLFDWPANGEGMTTPSWPRDMASTLTDEM